MVCLPISRLPDIESVCWGRVDCTAANLLLRRKETAGTSAHNILLARELVLTCNDVSALLAGRVGIHRVVYVRIILYPLCNVRTEEGGCDVCWLWNGSPRSLRFVPCQRPLYTTIQIDETNEFIHMASFYQRTSPGTTTERWSSRT
jgi:hypothetical protein